MNEQPGSFGGMTVNERLSSAGLLGQWDEAIESGQCDRAIEVLMRVALSEHRAAATVDAVLANPARYGFPRPR